MTYIMAVPNLVKIGPKLFELSCWHAFWVIWPGDLDLWPFDPKKGHTERGHFAVHFGFYFISLRPLLKILWYNEILPIYVTYLTFDLDLRPWPEMSRWKKLIWDSSYSIILVGPLYVCLYVRELLLDHWADWLHILAKDAFHTRITYKLLFMKIRQLVFQKLMIFHHF